MSEKEGLLATLMQAAQLESEHRKGTARAVLVAGVLATGAGAHGSAHAQDATLESAGAHAGAGAERSAGEQARESELRAIMNDLDPAAQAWYQTHVLGADSATQPPAGLVSAVGVRSPDDDPGAGYYDRKKNEIVIGDATMQRYRALGDGVPFVVAHELGHALEHTATKRYLETGEGQGAELVETGAERAQASETLSTFAGITALWGWSPRAEAFCQTPSEVEAKRQSEPWFASADKRRWTELVDDAAMRGMRASEKLEGYADDFGRDVVLATYGKDAGRDILGDAADQFWVEAHFEDQHPGCARARNESAEAQADPAHRPMRSHPPAMQRFEALLGKNDQFDVPAAPGRGETPADAGEPAGATPDTARGGLLRSRITSLVGGVKRWLGTSPGEGPRTEGAPQQGAAASAPAGRARLEAEIRAVRAQARQLEAQRDGGARHPAGRGHTLPDPAQAAGASGGAHARVGGAAKLAATFRPPRPRAAAPERTHVRPRAEAGLGRE